MLSGERSGVVRQLKVVCAERQSARLLFLTPLRILITTLLYLDEDVVDILPLHIQYTARSGKAAKPNKEKEGLKTKVISFELRRDIVALFALVGERLEID